MEYKDNITDDESLATIKNLFDELDRQNAPLPDGFGFTLHPSNGSDDQYADFAWKDKDVLLFTIDRKESYEVMNTKSTFKCYLLTESFDDEAFASEVKK